MSTSFLQVTHADKRPTCFYNYDFETLVVLGMFRLRGKAHNALIKPFNSIQDLGMTLRIAAI